MIEFSEAGRKAAKYIDHRDDHRNLLIDVSLVIWFDNFEQLNNTLDKR